MSRKFTKLFLLTLLIFAFALTGCTSGEESGAVIKSHLDKVIESNKLRVAVIPDNPPWSVMNASGEFEGYDVDIAKRLAEVLGVEIEFVSADGANRLPLVETDKVDVVISAFSSTDERARSIAFTEPYATAGPLPLYRKDNPLESFDDLAGKSVSVARGSTNDNVMTNYFPDTEVVRFDSISDAFAALRTSKVDALVEENPIVYELAEENPELEALNADPFKSGYIAMAVQQGDQIWLNYLNNFIRNFNHSGDNQELYKEWFGKDLPELGNY